MAASPPPARQGGTGLSGAGGTGCQGALTDQRVRIEFSLVDCAGGGGLLRDRAAKEYAGLSIGSKREHSAWCTHHALAALGAPRSGPRL